MIRTLVAEAPGTALLVAVVIDSAIMARDLGAPGPELLLANALATVGALYALIAVFSPVLVIFGALAARATVAGPVAAWIGAPYWFTASTSFANPAMLLARALTDTSAGIRPVDTPGFLAAQLAGGLLAAGLAAWLFRPEDRRDKGQGSLDKPCQSPDGFREIHVIQRVVANCTRAITPLAHPGKGKPPTFRTGAAPCGSLRTPVSRTS